MKGGKFPKRVVPASQLQQCDAPSLSFFDFLIMSTLQNEVLLETIYEEVLEELSSKNFHLLFSDSEINEMAEKLTLERFWDR